MRIIITLITGLFFFTSTYAAEFGITSPRFLNNGAIPTLYTCNGNNIPPTLTWTNAPANTRAFALVISNPDSTIGATFYNWVIYNIPATATTLAEGRKLPAGTLVGNNTYGEADYAGPCPENENVHHYYISIYALDSTLDLYSAANPDDVMAEISDHVIKQATLVGTFQH